MRVPLLWLRQYCDPPLDTAGIEERLTMTGTKVEAVLHHGVRAPEHFVLAKVLDVQAHPDADKLKVCEVDVGEEQPKQIVCGAPNVAVGQDVALALPGAVMPDGTKLKAAKLRGVRSEGMILAEDELQLSAAHSGIIVFGALDGGPPRAQATLPDGAPPARGGDLPHAPDPALPDAPEAAPPARAGSRTGQAPAAALARTPLTPGMPLAEVIELGPDVLELEVTPNRPDCLSIYGVARELHAATGAPPPATGAPLAAAPWREDPGTAGPVDGIAVEVDCPDLCPRFTARAFTDVSVAPSPLWLKARLAAAGQRPINNVVDITNYVMLLTGQPLHAFDLQEIEGARLRVRRAHDGERLVTLDGQTRTLDEEIVLIEDGLGPTSLAGVMGGERSEVADATTQVLIEAATWDGPNIHRTAGLLALRSEASARFEKDLAPEQCMHAQALASALMVQLCKAKLLPGTIDVAAPLPPLQSVTLREARVKAVLGIDVPRERQASILTALGFSVKPADGGLCVTVPPERRNDVSREADLIEEIARINGLDALPATLPARRGAYGLLSAKQRLRRKLGDALAGQGFYEIYGSTFVARDSAERLRLAPSDPRRQRAVALENPLSEDQALLRSTLLHSLLDAAARNLARGASDLKLFELGTVFLAAQAEAGVAVGEGATGATGARAPRSGATVAAANGSGRAPRSAEAAGVTTVTETRALGALVHGSQTPRGWRSGDGEPVDFFTIKATLEALGAALRAPLACAPAREPERRLPFLHPQRCAEIELGEARIGWIGELHPQLARAWRLAGGEERTELDRRTASAAFELDVDALLDAAVLTPLYAGLISLPSLREDLAVALPAHIPAAEVLHAVRAASSSLLDDAFIFDVYTGPQVGEGKRSLALALSFKAPDRTLTDAEIAPVRAQIIAALQALGGELRG